MTYNVFGGTLSLTQSIKAFKGYRLTDRQTDRRAKLYATPLRRWSTRGRHLSAVRHIGSLICDSQYSLFCVYP